MKFNGDEYHQAAIERMRQAREIRSSRESQALAMYSSGLAVECILRAFRSQKDPSFEGRYDPDERFRASGLLQAREERARKKSASEEEIERVAAEALEAMVVVATIRHNNLRFASEVSLWAHLSRIGRLRGIRGDALNKNSADLLAAAQIIVNNGVISWTSRRK